MIERLRDIGRKRGQNEMKKEGERGKREEENEKGRKRVVRSTNCHYLIIKV